MAVSPPPVMGAVSISEFPPWSSPRAATVRTTRPFFTRVVGSSEVTVVAVATLTTRMVPHASAPKTARTETNFNNVRSFIFFRAYFFWSFSTSTIATMEPAGMPAMATSSGFRASTFTSAA